MLYAPFICLIDWGLRGCIFRVCLAPGAAMLSVYRTGSRHVGCVSYRKPPCWGCIVPHWDPPCCTLHSFKFDWGRRGCIFRLCLAPGAAMFGVYRTGSRHVECVSYREPPCWVCIAPEAAMLGVY